jgi:hypothetical protein
MTLPGTLLRSLAGIVDEPHVLTGDATSGFAVDWTGRFRGHTPAVVRPGDTAEVAAVLAFGCVRGDLLASGVAQVPQVAFQVDEGHGGPLASGGGAGYERAEVVDQLADGLFGLRVAGCAAAGGRELAEQPQQQERLVRRTLLVDRCCRKPTSLASRSSRVRRWSSGAR